MNDTRSKSETPPRYWVGNLHATLCGLYAIVLLVMSFALSDQTKADLEVSTLFLIIAAALLLVFGFLFAGLASADHRAAAEEAAQDSARANSHSS